MKSAVLFQLFAIVLAYTDLDDSYNFESFTESNSNNLKNMLHCFLGKSPCNEVLLKYKSHIKEAINDNCAECSEEQKQNYKIFVTFSQKYFPEDFEELVRIFDKHNQ